MSVVLITGCSSGFGKETALAFARNGDTVFASMRDTSKSKTLEDAATAEALDIRIMELDVTKPATFAAAIGAIVAKAGRLDVLVNNAGVLRPGAFEDLGETGLREVMETNFFGPLLLARAVLPRMREQGSGYIVMISSLSGLAGLPGDVPYSASKFALEGASEALRHEIDRWGIKLALVQAGQYATDLFLASLAGEGDLPAGYPQKSPYRSLVEHQHRKRRERLGDAYDPRSVGELVVKIAASDGSQLRWPADAVATKVTGALLALGDKGRDEFLRSVSGTEWWSAGKPHADS